MSEEKIQYTSNTQSVIRSLRPNQYSPEASAACILLATLFKSTSFLHVD